jgi:hypothetical protein
VGVHDYTTVAVVTTALELVRAVHNRSPYIEIREHINLAGLDLSGAHTHVLEDVPFGVLSIQVSTALSGMTVWKRVMATTGEQNSQPGAKPPVAHSTECGRGSKSEVCHKLHYQHAFCNVLAP